ncbi:hypothetical protein SCAB_61231 [Streptomyces scabiei 87.22]|uniref:Uncharacterized protein n=1 Tax=Streptomyces scabiei (strain 87.22) TaxID=680198 RepID=C9Z955_STRSW|nr:MULTISPECIES: hypothetical protein [Streptomyces]MBP5875652.1 hypothetical protein [Streptomyces sp. LBUM 1477]MDX2652106.1 hypothetical protein [Streptomyces scabiei]MDX2725868.1 hypothetical protein [Streptomyces scabiei]MDX2749658.1 hypothetical protein [Streptomyces scabiei]MDX2863987.1 hypothetical protein [Streptomyces scabiei]
MAISFIGIGALSNHADTITPAYPAGATAGRLAVLQVVSAHTDESIPTTPSGWNLAGTFSGGGGVFGAAAGPRRVTFFTRVLVGSDAAPSTRIPSGSTGSLVCGRILVLDRSAGTGWRWAVTFGEDTSSGTGFSAAASTALTWAAGDFAVLGYGVSVSTASATAEAVAATGITFGTVTERADDAVTDGHDARLITATGAVSSGSGTQSPTVTATLAAAAVGVAGVLRVREATAAIAAVAQTAFPPRNLASVTGMLAENIVAATIYRVIGASRVAVRAAEAVDVTGQTALLRVDAEQPFGVAVSYMAELEDVNGNVWTVESVGTITSTVDGDVISDAIRGLGATVVVASWPDKKRDRDATQFNVGGRIVVVSRPRSSASATVLVRTETEEQGDALNEVLGSATEGIILIRARTSIPGVDGHVAALSDTEDRNWYDPVRRWSLDIVETEAWPTILEAAGFTLQDVADNYTSLADLAADNATLLALALKDFGV